ncbi:MAG TPA: WecB/TagA/CpsF family glycosyltransferase [Bacteroidota bacterium]|nr:WecB/TagA/CpsF family glycosyltransferase [Bacteroidota bacterium]
MDFPRETIWNVDVQRAELNQFLDAIDAGISQQTTPRTLFCANPHSLVVALHDRPFLSALRAADFLIPDGTGIVLASKILGGKIKSRVAGPDIMTGLASRWNAQRGKSFFFLGSSAGVLERIRARMASEFPHVHVGGVFSPSFAERLSDEENARICETINRAAPTALWVGMTAPKQEKWVEEHRSRLEVPLIAAVGAGFDYFAGSKQRASRPLQNLGLEWLPRLIREPRRMWRRNFISTPLFLYYVLRQRFGLLSAEPQ